MKLQLKVVIAALMLYCGGDQRGLLEMGLSIFVGDFLQTKKTKKNSMQNVSAKNSMKGSQSGFEDDCKTLPPCDHCLI